MAISREKKKMLLLGSEAVQLRTIFLVSFVHLVRQLKPHFKLNDRKQIFTFLGEEFNLSNAALEDYFTKGTTRHVLCSAIVGNWIVRFRKQQAGISSKDQALVYILECDLFHPSNLAKVLSQKNELNLLKANVLELLSSDEVMSLLKLISPRSAKAWQLDLNLGTAVPVEKAIFECPVIPKMKKTGYLDVSNMKVKDACEALHQKYFRGVMVYSIKAMMTRIANAQVPPQDAGKLFRDLKSKKQDIVTVMKIFEDSQKS